VLLSAGDELLDPHVQKSVALEAEASDPEGLGLLLFREAFPELPSLCLLHLLSPLAFVLIFVLSVFMSAVKNIVPVKKRGRGRPRKDDPIRTVVRIALSASTAERFAEWMETKGISSQSEAGRLLIERALEADAPAKPRRASKRES
jgi:hypothetical protein